MEEIKYMQNAELSELVEQLFLSSLAQVYQHDALIDLYHVLRQTWRNLAQPSDQGAYRLKLASVLPQIRNACLWCQQNSQLEKADLEVVGQIEDQFAQLEAQMKL
jgi:hypothetical protein